MDTGFGGGLVCSLPRAISKMSMGGDLNGVSVETLIITHVNCALGHPSPSLAVVLVISGSFKVMNAFHSGVWCY